MKRGLLTVNLIREIGRTFTRFLSILFIALLGAAFFTGIRSTGPDMKLTGDAHFDNCRLSDITVMSSAGITVEDIDELQKIEGVEAIMPALYVDALMQVEDNSEVPELNIRLLSLPLKTPEDNPAKLFSIPSYDIDEQPETEINRLLLVSGRLPLDDHEVAVDRLLTTHYGIKPGDYLLFHNNGGSVRLRVVGSVTSGLYISEVERGTSTVGTGKSDGFVYASGNAVGKLGAKLPMMALLKARYTSAYIRVAGAEALNSFSKEYESLVERVKQRIEDYGETTDATWYVQDRDSNPGYGDYSQNTDRIAAVGQLFPMIFFVVAALVALTTMTRMVEEQRIQMGTLKALGYKNGAIIREYIMYALLATLIGSVAGCAIGSWMFPYVIGTAYSIMYHLPNFQTPFHWDIAASATAAAVLCTTGAAIIVAVSALREVPASLMRPKAPKPGKRVFLEYVRFIWKHMGFTSKVTMRNLLRYKKRFFMSVIGIAGSCALLLTGFGLQDSIYGIIDKQFTDIWKMDVQAYTYDPIEAAEWEELLHDCGMDSVFSSKMLCYDKVMEAGKDDNDTTTTHLLAIGDPVAMQDVIVLYDNGEPFALPEGGVTITRKLSYIYDLSIGDEICVSYGTDTYYAKIAGIANNHVNHYVIFPAAYYEELFEEELLYNGVMARTVEDMAAIQDDVNAALLKDQRVYSVSATSTLYESVQDSLDILSYVVMVLILSAAALSFVVMFNLTNINITERRRELATLQVLGFYDRELYDYVFRENNALAVIGAITGLAMGLLLHKYVIETCEVDIVMFVREIKTMSFVYSALLTMAFSLIVNIFMRRKVRGIDMVESLKSAE